VDFHRRDPSLPGLEELLDRVVAAAFGGEPPAELRQAEVRRAAQGAVVGSLLDLARSRGPNGASPAVRARTDGALAALGARLRESAGDGAEAAHRRYLAGEIARYLERRLEGESPLPGPAEPPPGAPIGMDWLGSGCEWNGG
jgi:hypothetical protein